MKKILIISASVIAVLALMLPMLISCGNPEGPSGETTPAQAATSGAPEETKRIYDDDGYLLDDIPGDLNYGGNSVRILYWSDSERPEFEIKEEQLSGAIVEEAIYNRNVNTEERLGVSFEWIGKAGNNSNISNFVSFVEAQYNGGDYFDIIASYSRTVGTLICRGFMQDLNAIENSYINYEKPWWPKTLLSTCDINGHLFAISGDISTNVLHFMYAIYYNKNLLDEMKIDDPVQFVDNKTWTVDKLIELTSNAYADLDNDGKRSEGDRYGFGSIYFHLDAFYTGSGLRLLETDPDAIIVISEDFGSQKAIDLA
ncbi:MAG: extracellular solute-binding protein, partial [Clostridia bacterium]|nr:extracellular solute-binding protein [Clostridia bacterium]